LDKTYPTKILIYFVISASLKENHPGNLVLKKIYLDVLLDEKFLTLRPNFIRAEKTYPAENTILLVFASPLEFTAVNIVFTMKALLLLLPLERERQGRRERERERERYSQRDVSSQTEEFPHMVLAMEINDKKMKNR
jgi:hypothetical protein